MVADVQGKFRTNRKVQTENCNWACKLMSVRCHLFFFDYIALHHLATVVWCTAVYCSVL